MRPETAMFLRDVRDACLNIEMFIQGKSLGDYLSELLLRSGVEREFIIVGEALMRASKIESDQLVSITGLREIIGFRNLLVHGYAVIEDNVVWDVANVDLKVLLREVQALLATADPV